MKKLLIVSIVVLVTASSWCVESDSNVTSYVKKTYMVPMRDGVRLATDVYLPDEEGRWPTILVRTPYNKNISDSYIISLVVDVKKYALVVQDTRGRFSSEGVDMVFLDDGWGERQDGYDTVEWIAEQNWSNGKIGTWGGSALGITQYMMAGSTPPHLTCQCVGVAPPNLYKYAVFQGGELRKSLVEIWLAKQGSTHMIPIYEAHPYYDEFWENYDLSTRYHLVNVPIYHLGGWHDLYTDGTIDAFVGIQTRGAEGAFGNQKLCMGPWSHNWEGLDSQIQGELIFPKNSVINLVEETFNWFDYWLKGEGKMDEHCVRYYVMGECDIVGGEFRASPDAPGNEWRYSNSWPPENISTSFYFHEDGSLNTVAPVSYETPSSYLYDPSNPVPTIGGRNMNIPGGPRDQRPIEERDDVIVFTTPPLTKPVEVVGNIKARIWASSSALDTDWSVRLCDVYPDGHSMLVADGILMARHRNKELLTPGEIYEFEIDLWSTAIVFNKGHRIRVSVTSSNYPRFERNPNTGEPFHRNTTYVVAENTIYHDVDHPSHIILPIIKKIERPREGYLYVGDKEIIPTPGGNTLIIGKVTVEFSDYPEVEKVEFYVDDVLKSIDTEPPYVWLWDETVVGRHTLKVIAFKGEQSVDDEMDVIIFNIGRR